MTLTTGCAVVATYSMANGLFVWPVLGLLSFRLRLPTRYRILLGIATGIMAIAYLSGYQSPAHHANPGESITRHLPLLLAFAATFLGSPVDPVVTAIVGRAGFPGDGLRVVCAAVAGAAGFCATVILAAILWRKRDHARAAHWALLHVLLFILITAVAVGLGRINFPLIEAMTSRYVTPAMVFWITLVLLAWSLAEPVWLAKSARLRNFASVSLVLACLSIAVCQKNWIRLAEGYAAGVGAAQSAIAAGVLDEEQWRAVYHTPMAMLPAVDYLRSNRLSVFAEDWTAWTGTPLASHFQIDKEGTCVGHFDQATLILSFRPGSRVSGWVWDPKAGRGPQTVVLADEAGQIAGVAREVVPRADIAASVPMVKSAMVGWRGYIPGTENKLVTAYLLETDGKSLCSLGRLPTGFLAPAQ